MALHSIEEIIEDIRQGKIDLFDGWRTENKDDLIMAAEMVTPEAINFMAKYGRGTFARPPWPKPVVSS